MNVYVRRFLARSPSARETMQVQMLSSQHRRQRALGHAWREHMRELFEVWPSVVQLRARIMTVEDQVRDLNRRVVHLEDEADVLTMLAGTRSADDKGSAEVERKK